jgi:hypothetical protein
VTAYNVLGFLAVIVIIAVSVWGAMGLWDWQADEDLLEALWVAALDRVPIEERIEWVKSMTARVAAINAKRQECRMHGAGFICDHDPREDYADEYA